MFQGFERPRRFPRPFEALGFDEERRLVTLGSGRGVNGPGSQGLFFGAPLQELVVVI